VLSGVKEIREAIEKAQFMKEHQQRNTILFVDEVHRFNKSQQDAFCLILSPVLSLLSAQQQKIHPLKSIRHCLSRCQVYVLKTLSDQELQSILDKALELYPERSMNETARALVVSYADGDARKLINLAEMLLASDAKDNKADIDENDVNKHLQEEGLGISYGPYDRTLGKCRATYIVSKSAVGFIDNPDIIVSADITVKVEGESQETISLSSRDKSFGIFRK